MNKLLGTIKVINAPPDAWYENGQQFKAFQGRKNFYKVYRTWPNGKKRSTPNFIPKKDAVII